MNNESAQLEQTEKKRKRPGKLPSREKLEIYILDGYSYEDIGKKFNLDRTTVSRLCFEYGLDKKRGLKY